MLVRLGEYLSKELDKVFLDWDWMVRQQDKYGVDLILRKSFTVPGGLNLVDQDGLAMEGPAVFEQVIFLSPELLDQEPQQALTRLVLPQACQGDVQVLIKCLRHLLQRGSQDLQDFLSGLNAQFALVWDQELWQQSLANAIALNQYDTKELEW